ncbi:hypothetical protein KQX54_007334 [Cotesia glomerata]|uniref:Uncharacterized protein n=1 Tax=Cotesia glomerata TaxID=32391 RepID=A0AAV7J4T7_COTGL|nr:hypothetical protein KQX54_007334 [Cotesia glomerata]
MPATGSTLSSVMCNVYTGRIRSTQESVEPCEGPLGTARVTLRVSWYTGNSAPAPATLGVQTLLCPALDRGSRGPQFLHACPLQSRATQFLNADTEQRTEHLPSSCCWITILYTVSSAVVHQYQVNVLDDFSFGCHETSTMDACHETDGVLQQQQQYQ